MQRDTQHDTLYSVLDIKRDTLYKWISNNKMPAHRMGRLWKFKKDEVDEWIKAGGASKSKNRKTNK